MDSFASGRGISAAALNRLSSDAARKGLAGSAYLAHSNGFELVQRNPRRQRGRGRGGAVEVPEYDPNHPAPENPDGTGRYTVRVVVDWKYDLEDNKFKVLYGTLVLAGGVLSIVPDTVADGEGNIVVAWSDGTAGAPHGPLGGSGVQAVEESY